MGGIGRAHLNERDKQCLCAFFALLVVRIFILNAISAAVAELVDAHVSGACIRKDVGVRLPPAALKC